MAVYFIAFIHELRDPAGLAEYARLAVPTVTGSKGTQVAAALNATNGLPGLKKQILGDLETLEGNMLDGVSMIKFPDRQAFDDWYYSDAYQTALKLRKAAADVQVIVVEGV